MLRSTIEGHAKIGLAEDVTAAVLERKRIEHERDHDILTGLYNRQAFNRVCTELFAAPERMGVAALMKEARLGERRGKAIGLGLLGGVAATLIVVLPFAWGENIFTWLVDKYAATLSGYPHATLSTGNLMFLLGGNWVDESTALIGSITFVFSASGIRLGNVFGLRYKSKAEFAGGVILILLGTKILLEHLGVL